MSFVHLHNHTHYSLLDASTKPKELILAALNDGQPAVALTDHGVMFGAIEFFQTAKSNNIKPIIGFEAYIANGSRFDKPQTLGGKKEKNYYHTVLLAKDNAGYKNLLRLTSIGFSEGFYRKPRIDREVLEKYKDGIICTTACLGGIVNSDIMKGNLIKAKNDAHYYKDIFGEDFYIELQRHNYPDDERLIEEAVAIAKELDIKIICTNDIHYLKKEHALAHNVLLNISSSQRDIDYKSLRYKTEEFYFKTTQEMKELFFDYPEAISNTLEIADKCNAEINLKTLYMPVYPIPQESKSTDLGDYLRELTNQKLTEKFGDTLTQDYIDRIEYELSVIIKMGFPGYFLIVQDFINESKKRGVPVGPGRGSAAGSLVAYVLGITEIDPLKYDLLFERFLNPERVSMPDIDIDFCDKNRSKAIEYVKEKYGEKAVAQIVTFGKLSSKAVITDVGRVLNIPLADIKQITSFIPTIQGKVLALKDVLKLPEIDNLMQSDKPKIKELIDISLILEGVYRGRGTHAAGIIIAPGDMEEFVPVCTPLKDKKDEETISGVDIVTQYPNSKGELEAAGLLKMDFLGLQTLSIIENTLDMIEHNYGNRIKMDSIPLDDLKTYETIGRGDTLAIFQFESTGMQEYLKQLKPKSIEELTAMNALYRPGPMSNIPEFIKRKNHPERIAYMHPLMEPVLNKTYGIIVYQEQVIKLVQVIANFSLGQADILRRAMGKKDKKTMADFKSSFADGAKNNNIDIKTAETIFDLIEKFAEYGFNKSHSVAYSYLAYQTAYLKTHYPAEFYAANMTAEMNDQKKLIQLIDEAKKYDIKVLPPDINRSYSFFHAVGKNEIYYGLAGIRNVGVPIVEDIVKVRSKSPFISFIDYISRVDKKSKNRRSIEALICAGAFDSIEEGKRAPLFEAIDIALEYAKNLEKEKANNTVNLFGGFDDVSNSNLEVNLIHYDTPEWTEKKKLQLEKEYLNFYISGHPLSIYQNILTQFNPTSLEKIQDMGIHLKADREIVICGMINTIVVKRDKNEKQFAIITLEDYHDKHEAVVWSSTYERYFEQIIIDEPLVLLGEIKLRNGSYSVNIDAIFSINEAIQKFGVGYKIFINIENSIDMLEKLKKLSITQLAEPKDFIFSLYSLTDDYRSEYKAQLKMDLNIHTFEKLIEIFDEKKIGNVKLLTKEIYIEKPSKKGKI